jgi:hypothetical protein
MDEGRLFKTGLRMTPQTEKLFCSLSLSLLTSTVSTNLVDNSSIWNHYHPRD